MEKLTQIGVVAIAVLLLMAGVITYGATTGMWKGDKGAKGDTGATGPTGLIGPIGPTGLKGNDAPINVAPTTTLSTMDGEFIWIFPSYLHYCQYTYGISVVVDDPEDQTMRVTFYCTENLSKPWNEVSVFFGKDGTYSTSESFTYSITQGNKKLYWLVEAWDGSDIKTETFSYTISP